MFLFKPSVCINSIYCVNRGSCGKNYITHDAVQKSHQSESAKSSLAPPTPTMHRKLYNQVGLSTLSQYFYKKYLVINVKYCLQKSTTLN